MLKLHYGTTVPEYFGDFGGRLCINDTDFARRDYPVGRYEEILASDAFDTAFHEILGRILPPARPARECEAGGAAFTILPALGRYYNLAGHLTLALLDPDVKKVFLGTGDRELLVLTAKEAAVLGLKADLVPSRELALNAAFVDELRGYGANVDDKTTVEFFDLPYGLVEVPFDRDHSLWPIPATANYGCYPKPGLCGIFAGIYGEELYEQLSAADPHIVVPVDTGLEALSVFKALRYSGAKLYTAEETVCMEHHACDTGTYTLVKKTDSQLDGLSVSLCPELVSMWRDGRVIRLGCDRVLALDTKPFENAGLSAPAARAAALLAERTSRFVVFDKSATAAKEA